jgi:DNA ligase (NAD+)
MSTYIPRKGTAADTGNAGHFDYRATNEPTTGLKTPLFADHADYEAAVSQALAASRAYYDDGETNLSDAEFDSLLERLALHELAHDLETTHGLHDTIGHGGEGGGDVEHSTPMLSLDKPGPDAVEAFAKAHPDAIVEPKIDGLAIRCVYENGQLVLAARRGDGQSGENVTDRVRGVEGLPESAGSGDFEVRGEIYLSDANLPKANAVRAAAGKNPFANARNGVAGMLNKQDGTYKGLLSFAAYSTTYAEDKDHLDQMGDLTELGFTTARSLLPESVLNAPDPMAAIEALGEERATLGFLMDGAVVKVPTNAEKEKLGEGTRAPKWAVAYKYKAVEGTSRILAIETSFGKTGRLALRARIEPVEVDGSVVEYASLHNVGWLQASGIRVGSEVQVFKANDIIPQVKLPEGVDPADSPAWDEPKVCPDCGGDFDKSTDLWRCTSPECSVSGRIHYAASRDAGFDIEGLGGAIGDALIEADLVKDVGDLFTLDHDHLAYLDIGDGRRLGDKTAAKIMAEIEKAKSAPWNRVITSLSMRMTGRTMGRRLAAEFPTANHLLAATEAQLANVEGIGSKKAAVIRQSIQANAQILATMAATGVNMGSEKTESDGGNALAGQNVVVTGSMKSDPRTAALTRGSTQELIEAHGGKASGSVSKSTNLLVCGEAGSSKWVRAQELGIPIVTPTEFADMLGL